jgi:hypothetical protein
VRRSGISGTVDSVTQLYADRPTIAARQFLTDLLVVVWVGGWIWAAMWVHDLVERLAAPGRKVEGAGTGMADNLTEAGSTVDNIPGVGDALAAPFNRAADAARSLAEAGRDQQEVVGQLALTLSLALLVLPLAIVLVGWLPLRVRWIRRAGAAAALRGGPAGRDLLALRALTNQPVRRIAAIGADPVGAWRKADPAAVEALAALELRSLGLRP